MQDENICITCGHDKWSHAISLKGVVGACLKETIKGWEYCSCQTFTPPSKARSRLPVGGRKSAVSRVCKTKVIHPLQRAGSASR